MSRVDFENHFASEMWVAALYANEGYPTLVDDATSGQPVLYYGPDIRQPYGGLTKLLDLGQRRIEEMDRFGIDFALLSLTAPGVEQLEPGLAARIAANANDILSEAVRTHPGRFGGFATLGPKDPEVAVRELERAVRELGLSGWYVNSNFGDSYLDAKAYWPILAKCEQLGAPIYVHPTVPMIQEFRSYGLALAGPSFGFGMEAALVMMRLIFSGALDAFPRLTIILGHYGEGLPFFLNRVDRAFLQGHVKPDTSVAPTLLHAPSYYLRKNLFVSTSGNYLREAFECTRNALGIDKMVLGTDYPYETASECIGFLEEQGLSMSDKAKLYYENAQRLGVEPRKQ